MKKSLSCRVQRAFTLVELLVAMTITTILVFIILTVTNQSVEIFRVAREDVDTNSRGNIALNALVNDFQAIQIGTGSNNYEWLFAKSDDTASSALSIKRTRTQKAQKSAIPLSVECLFFASTKDRNPAVSSNNSLRESYRRTKAHNIDTQGDVNAVGYRLLYRDDVLRPGETGTKKKTKGKVDDFPLYSLYRQLISPRDAYTYLMGKSNLAAAYESYRDVQEGNLLCENIIDMNLVFTIDYNDQAVPLDTGRVSYQQVSVPIISSRGRQEDVRVNSDHISVSGKDYENARIVSINISFTVVTEEGMHFIERVRTGKARITDRAQFMSRYTRTYSARVAPPHFGV